MPGFSAGAYTRWHKWVDDRLADIDITDTRMDEEDDGFAEALSRCILKDGSQTITQDIPWNGKKITGLANGTLPADAINLGQADARYVSTVAPAMSGALAITSTSNAALVVGPNGATNPVFQVNASVAGAITGLMIVGNEVGATGTQLITTSSGADAALRLYAKGTGSIILQNPTIITGAVSTNAALSVGTTLTVGGAISTNTYIYATTTITAAGQVAGNTLYATGPVGNAVKIDGSTGVQHIQFLGNGIARGYYGANVNYSMYVGNSAATAMVWCDHSGNTNIAGSFYAVGNVTAYSDASMKRNVRTIDDALDKVRRMRGVLFDRTDIEERGAGVVAQELREIAPELVQQGDTGKLAVAYGNLVAYLIEAVKILADDLDEQKRFA